jgi:hypothetical protein
MNVALKYKSGQTYSETIKTGTVKIKMRGNRMLLLFKSEGQGKAESTIVMTPIESQRLVHALQLARSAEETLVQFPIGEIATK